MLIFSPILSETLLGLRRTGGDMIMNVHKVTAFLIGF